MKISTRMRPMMQAILPARIESAPRSGPTVRSSRMVSGAGKAPARSSNARSFASTVVKLPEMMPEPPMIGSRMTGALMTLPSSTMAKGRPTFALVTLPNFLAPVVSKRKLITGRPCSTVGWESTRVSPATMIRFFTTYSMGRPVVGSISSSEGRISEPGGGLPPRARISAAETVVSTRRKFILAVWPSNLLTRSGSSMPGSCTMMRSRPWRWIEGSEVPNSSIRRRTISTDWAMTWLRRSVIASSV